MFASKSRALALLTTALLLDFRIWDIVSQELASLGRTSRTVTVAYICLIQSYQLLCKII